MGISCSTCIYYNGFINKCMDETVTKQMREPNDWCANHIFKPKQEAKQMKSKINETHEVKLDGTWYEVEPKFIDEQSIYFYDPRPMPSPIAPAPAAPAAPQPVTTVIMCCVLKRSTSHYRVNKVVNVIVNETFDIVHTFDKDEKLDYAVQVNHRRAKLILE